ncbi:hypothetical protein IE53DRAFT_386334 [Violaceomyces palustris]|uniref:Uncharacterized protein n=1 Tax=Violaceomyces palustris TaxID=1673888 RepID=A0ACD0NZQ7_9BASI|nr:hypothetical protein IE53DRAFT_386334 [Violaceomyces palustris]
MVAQAGRKRPRTSNLEPQAQPQPRPYPHHTRDQPPPQPKGKARQQHPPPPPIQQSNLSPPKSSPSPHSIPASPPTLAQRPLHPQNEPLLSPQQQIYFGHQQPPPPNASTYVPHYLPEQDAYHSGSVEESFEEDEQDQASFSFVFQCKSCRSIVGDSISWKTSRKDMGLVVLSHVSDRARSSETLQTSSEPGLDLGSTYSTVECASCDAELGRRYRTTSRNLDDLRDAYSLRLEALTVYQLGSSISQSDPNGPLPSDSERIASIKDWQRQEGQEQRESQAPVRRSSPPNSAANDKTRLVLMAIGERLVRVERRLEQLYSNGRNPPAQEVQQSSNNNMSDLEIESGPSDPSWLRQRRNKKQEVVGES